MAVLVMLSASLRRHVPGYNPLTGMQALFTPGLKVADILGGLKLAPEEVKIIMVNGVHSALDHDLADGDRVGLFPAVGGG